MKINSTGSEFFITKGRALVSPQGTYLPVIAIHPPTQLGVSVLFACNDSSSLQSSSLLRFLIDAIMEEVLDYLIPLVEKETAGIIDPLYTGHYVCKATPPIHSQPLNLTVEVLGGSIDIADSPSRGLSASVNLSLLFDGQPTQKTLTAGMLLNNSTENSFWLGVGDCFTVFDGISDAPSTTYPNYPKTDYLKVIEFDFESKTVLWPATGAVCLKNVGLDTVSQDITLKTSYSSRIPELWVRPKLY